MRAADDRCRTISPQAVLVVHETAAREGEQSLEAKTKPVLFQCMGCSGALVRGM